MQAIEFEYITKGSVDHKETIPPRALTEDETEVLRKLLKTKLNIDHEEDASDLLDYAMDMIEDGKNVGHVAEEVSVVLFVVFKSCSLANQKMASLISCLYHLVLSS